MRFITDPRQARTVKMKDGTTYPVGVGGSFVVTRADHVSELERGNHDYYSNAVTFGGGDSTCLCGRAPWAWERKCPRCGRTVNSSSAPS